MNESFEGFAKPKQNWFKMPNEWTDITCEMTSLAELKVMEYILRHTWGFSEYDKPKKITTDEFMHGRKRKDGSRMDRGTGLSHVSVINGLRRAVDHLDDFVVLCESCPKKFHDIIQDYQND